MFVIVLVYFLTSQYFDNHKLIPVIIVYNEYDFYLCWSIIHVKYNMVSLQMYKNV